jgi:hypothetical protein
MYGCVYCYGFTSSVGYSRSNLIELLVYDGMRTIFRASVLYYKSIGIAPTLPMRC